MTKSDKISNTATTHAHHTGHDHHAGHEHGHSHSGLGHSHVPKGAQHRWRLKVAFVMVGLFFLVELATGIWSGSLTLQGDAGHMAIDLVGLGVALFATNLATRPDTTGRFTYGHYRAEIFSAGLSAIFMFAISIYIVTEAIERWSHPHQLAPWPILIVGALGLIVNIISLVLLQGGSEESLNIKGAYLEVMADALGSVGIIIAAVLTMLTGTPIWDSIIAAVIAVFIFVRAIGLAREVLAILSQKAPAGIHPEDAQDALAQVP